MKPQRNLSVQMVLNSWESDLQGSVNLHLFTRVITMLSYSLLLRPQWCFTTELPLHNPTQNSPLKISPTCRLCCHQLLQQHTINSSIEIFRTKTFSFTKTDNSLSILIGSVNICNPLLYNLRPSHVSFVCKMMRAECESKANKVLRSYKN